jgi:hypothetical protein
MVHNSHNLKYNGSKVKMKKAGICLLVALSLTISLGACKPASTDNTSKLSCIEAPYAFQGVYAMHSYRTEPYEVEVELETNLPDVADHLIAYKVIIPDINDTYARELAHKLGFFNEWPLKGTREVYSFTKENQTLEITLDGRLTLRQDVKINTEPISLPSDEDCVDIARNWLTNNFYPSNVTRAEIGYGGVSVATVNSETGQTGPTTYYSKSVRFIPTIKGYEQYSNAPYVLVGDQGKIVEASVDLTSLQEYGLVKLKTPQAALDLLEKYLEMPTSAQQAQQECISNTDGSRIVINKVTVQYNKISQSDIMVPIFVFEGEAFSGNSEPEKFTGRVDGVLH